MRAGRSAAALSILVTLGAAVLLGLVAGQSSGVLPGLLAAPVGLMADLPAAALIALVALLAAVPAALRRWPLAVIAFFGWLVVEDLVRKLAGNDLRVYFVKDVAFAVLVLALIVRGRTAARGWQDAVGRAGLPLYLLMGWALVMAVPTGLEDWRLPLVGLRLNFLYVPLVVAGYLLTYHLRGLRAWLTGLGLLGGATSLVGVVQAVIGPGFLASDVPVPHLSNLVLVRGIAGAGDVYRPTGTFVEPGRFVAVVVVGLAISLAASNVTAGWRRRSVLLATIAAVGGIWVSGGRGSLVAGGALVAVAAIAPSFGLRQARLGRASSMALLAVSVVGAFAVVAPDLVTSRVAWYGQTLNPASPEQEWTSRWRSYWTSTVHGVDVGGGLGTGTGSQSLGRQYLYEGRRQPDVARSVVEGGYAAVAVEWGVVGLVLWLWWTLAWLGRQWRCVAEIRGSPAAGAGLILFGWMALFLIVGFFGGLQSFQNYVVNAYFWFLSGVLFALPRAVRRDREQLQPA